MRKRVRTRSKIRLRLTKKNDDYNNDDVENEYEDEGYEEEVTSKQQLIAFGLEKCQQLFHLPEKESSFD